MSIIDLDLSDRTVAAICLMSHMLYPDDAELRLANEINLRTITAHWCSARFAQENRRVQGRLNTPDLLSDWGGLPARTCGPSDIDEERVLRLLARACRRDL